MARAARRESEKPARRAKKTQRRQSLFHRGSEARARTDTELAKAKAKREQRKRNQDMPWRYWLRPEEEGAQIIILDETPDFFLYEHNMRDPDNPRVRRDPVPCISEFDTCAVCETGNEPTYCMFLSVIDLREAPKRDGTGSYDFTRKLFVVKPRSQKKFLKRAEKTGSLRGQLVSLYRSDDRTPVIGDEIDFEDEVYIEDELAEFVREYTDSAKKTHVEDCSEPYDYEELFVAPSAEDLRALVGGKPPAGSAKEAEETLGEDGWDEDTEDEEKEEETPRRGRSKKKSIKKKAGSKKPGRRAAADEDEIDDEDEAPHRTARRAPEPTVARRKIRRTL